MHHYDNGSLITSLSAHKSEISTLIFLPHKHALLSISYDGFVRLHDTQAASTLATARVPPAPVPTTIPINPTPAPPAEPAAQQNANSASSSSSSMNSGMRHHSRSVLKTAHFPKEVCCAAYSQLLGLVASVSKDGVIRIWDVERYVVAFHLRFINVLQVGHGGSINTTTRVARRGGSGGFERHVFGTISRSCLR